MHGTVDDHQWRARGAGDEAAVAIQPRTRVEDDPRGLAVSKAGQADRQHRVVGPCGSDPDHHGLVGRAGRVHPGVGYLARNHQAWAAGRPGRVTVRGFRKLQRDGGPTVHHAPDMPHVIASGFFGADFSLDRDARFPQLGQAPTGHARIRVASRDHDPRDARRDDSLRTAQSGVQWRDPA